ncbi:MAG: DUF2817 domain-containing protein [Dehalococcoidia bacterium]|nr:DUF2817 domain-containing protein [Dehalococcoidia bacterium]
MHDFRPRPPTLAGRARRPYGTIGRGAPRSRWYGWYWFAAAGVVAVLFVAALAAFRPGQPGVAGVTAIIHDSAPAAAPIATTAVIGHSLEGRPIEATSIGAGATLVLIGGLHAGPEAVSVDVVDDLREDYVSGDRELLGGVELVFIPAANPDGLAAGTRVNAAGVDLNRNWPTGDWSAEAIHTGEVVSGGTAPLSEPETRALHDYLVDLRPALVLSVHGFGGVVDDNEVGRASELAARWAEAAGFEHIEEWTEYEISGQLIDALAGEGIPAADIELAEGDTRPTATAREALEAVLEALAAR